MIKKMVFLTILLSIFSGCSSNYPRIESVEVYKPSSPYAGEPRVQFGNSTGGVPLFKFWIVKGYFGIPSPKDLQLIKTKGASMGASELILDCPRQGTMGDGTCIVYGYK